MKLSKNKSNFKNILLMFGWFKIIHGGTHGSSYTCSRGLSYLSLMGEEALGPVEA